MALSGVIFSSSLERRDSRRRSSSDTIILHPVENLPAPTSIRPIGKRLGYLGRLHRKKNLEALLAGLAQVPGASLRVAGDGDPNYERALRTRAQTLGVASRVVWLGFLADKDAIAAFFAEIDVLVMPSHYECFGMVAAESLAAGVPVVVSENTAGSPTSCENTRLVSSSTLVRTRSATPCVR